MKRLLPFFALLLTTFAWGQPSVRLAQHPYLMNVTTEGFTVIWTTDLDALAWVEIAPDDGTNFYASARERHYDSRAGQRLLGKFHCVHISGLTPATTYRFRVAQQAVICNEGNKRVILGEGFGNDIHKEQPYEVTTRPATEPDELEFWTVNDIHGRDSIVRKLLCEAPEARPDFVCLNGDMTSQIENEPMMTEGYLQSIAKLLTPSGIPVIASRGNHENRGAYSSHWLDYFPTPTGETYYTFRRGPVFFVVLDGGEDKPDSDFRYYGLIESDAYRRQEAQWLQKVVESEAFRSAPYRVVLIHMVSGDQKSWHGEQEIRQLFTPLLCGRGIDLMLCGHYHKYRWIDDQSRGTDFPILINSNSDCTRIKADDKALTIEVVNPDGTTLHTHRIDKKSK